jgi:TPR repeat protein
MYAEGDETLQDFTLAKRWLECAAKSGDPEAQRRLGDLYAKGWGVEKNALQAYVWYDMAAAGDDEQARHHRQQIIGTMTEQELAQAQKRAKEIASHIPSSCSMPPAAPEPTVAASRREGNGPLETAP